ncbi:lamin tail domain-containing protein, partial [bacterium]|nr:lamin tail domain-containing protein [candidate division CSSED10-310 bacterium]
DTGLEYIELYNAGFVPVVLTGYDLKPDDSGYFTFPEFTLFPDSYVVVHVNATGTNTATDLYTGPGTNMGNTAGFIALFNSATHSAGTLIDYIAYGAGGQTWESAAVDAGIWTPGDFVPFEEIDGPSINLCPNGIDLDSSENWQLDTNTPGYTNACHSPTPSPTATVTPEPTQTPTSTPTPHPTVEPIIRMAGFGETDFQNGSGGTIRILAWVVDPESDIERVWVTLGGEWVIDLFDDGFHGDFDAGDGFYGFQFDAPAAVDPSPDNGPLRLQLRIHASDGKGYTSNAWPLLTVDQSSGLPFTQHAPWWDHMDHILGTAPDQAPGSHRPFIYMAGFMDTRITAEGGGDFTLLAVTTGSAPVTVVELYYYGLPTGVYLMDDGRNNDFSAGDGVFGLSFHVNAGTFPAGDYALQLRAFDVLGNRSDLWPYLTLTE